MTLDKASKHDLIRTFSGLTMNKIIDKQYPSIAQLKRYYHPEKVEKVTAIILSDLSGTFNGALDDDSVKEISVEITATMLANLSLEDVFVVCRNIKFSKVFGKLDTNKTLTAMKNYMDEKTEAIGMRSHSDHLAKKPPRSRGNDMALERSKFQQAVTWHEHFDTNNNNNNEQRKDRKDNSKE